MSSFENNCVDGNNFRKDYVSLCFDYNLCPARCIKKIYLSKGSLHCLVDTMLLTHWLPLLDAIAMNRNLKGILLHSTFLIEQSKNHNFSVRSFLSERNKIKEYPSVFKQKILVKLFVSLRECVSNNRSLKHLEITGVPLTVEFIENLSNGIQKSVSIQHLCLANCFITDEGLSILCQCLKKNTTIKVLDLSNCHITDKGIEYLALVIEHQGIHRHNAIWHGSLRYHQPVLDSFPGISRIILNDNKTLSDRGIEILAKSLANDLWLKALDLQNCNITDIGAQFLLEVLMHNTVIEILDLKRNSIGTELLDRINEKLNANNKGKMHEYEWLSSKKCTHCDHHKQRRKYKPGLPQRSITAKKKPDSSKALMGSKQKHVGRRGFYDTIKDDTKKVKELASSSTSSTADSNEMEEWMETCQQLKKELRICLQQLEIEQGRRKLAEMKIKQLQNQTNNTASRNGYTLVDDSTMAMIQNTFTKFQQFLNFLRISGMEDFERYGTSQAQDFLVKDDQTKQILGFNEITDNSRRKNDNSILESNPVKSTTDAVLSVIKRSSQNLNSGNDDLFNIIRQRIPDTWDESRCISVTMETFNDKSYMT